MLRWMFRRSSRWCVDGQSRDCRVCRRVSYRARARVGVFCTLWFSEAPGLC